MHYKSFEIKNYRAIGHVIVNLDRRMIPLVGVNECGKTTILQAIFCFDSTNDNEQDEKHFKDNRGYLAAPQRLRNIFHTPYRYPARYISMSVSSTLLSQRR